MTVLDNINWHRVAALAQSQLQRLFHGRGLYFDQLSHINIDWLPPVILIVLYKEEKPSRLEELSQQLLTKMQSIGFDVKSIQIQYRCRDLAPTQRLLGQVITDFVAQEKNLRYKINLGSKQNYGIFLDMKNTRQWLQENSHGKHVLNLFSYTCAFSNVAIEGGATQVINLDMSKAALAIGRENHRLNQHDLTKVKYLAHNLFKSWGKVQRLGPYDIVIVDPPTFQKGSINIKRDYPKIIRRLPGLLNKGGLALLCLNAPDLTFEFLEEAIRAQCPEANILQKIMPEEHFINLNVDRGLKCLLVNIHQ